MAGRPWLRSNHYGPGFGSSSEGNELFSGRWMDSNSRIELSLGRPAVQRNRESLDDLACVRSDHVTAEDPIGRAIDDQLHHCAVAFPRQRVLERPERTLV